MPPETFSWHEKIQKNLIALLQKNRLPHALLFIGSAGLAKKQFAHTFARIVLCRQREHGICCEQCQGCHLTRAGSHPDLKFILVSDQHSHLPITVLSRCQKIIFTKPSTAIGMAWLKEKLIDPSIDAELLFKLAEGAPLKALALAQENIFSIRQQLYQGLCLLAQKKMDPVLLAAECYEKDLSLLIYLLQLWLRDLLRMMTVAADVEIVNEDFRGALSALATKFSPRNLLQYLDDLQEMHAHIVQGLNLNKQLVVEEFFIRMTENTLCT
jgi:DNA polymerase III gamma/tau subunit